MTQNPTPNYVMTKYQPTKTNQPKTPIGATPPTRTLYSFGVVERIHRSVCCSGQWGFRNSVGFMVGGWWGIGVTWPSGGGQNFIVRSPCALHQKSERGVCRATGGRYIYITLHLDVWFLLLTESGGLVCFVTVGGGCLCSRVYDYV